LVLGYIIAGLLVGPQVKIFPTVVDNENIQTWAEIGVIFLLFSLGLEFSFKKLAKVGGTSTITAFTEIIIVVIAGYFTGKMMGWKTIDCIFLGGMLASSSTTIIIRAFDELKVKSQQFAKTVFGVLIVEDIVVILILVLLPTIAISQKIQGNEMFFTVLKLIFFLLLWFLLGIFLIPTFLKRARNLIDNETLLVISIGMCFGMVVLATNVGFSAELGAFIMGSIFAETTKAEKIEHILSSIKDLFGAIFFVSIGMMIDLQAMWQYIIPILIITLLTIVGKFSATALGALISGQTLKHSVKVGMSMAQIGEFAFIIATLGLSLGVTSNFLFPVAVGVSVITTFTTPYMIKYADNAYVWIDRLMPKKFTDIINNYSSYSQSVGGTSQWQKVLKSYMQLILLNGVIILAIIFLSIIYLMTFVDTHVSNPIAAKVITVVVTSLLILPFLWGLAVKRPAVASSYQIIKQNKKFSWAPMMVINLVRILIALLLFGFLLDRVFASWVALIITFSAVVLVLFLFRKRFQKLYGRIEGRFLSNLNEREKAALYGIDPSELVPVPWDIHLAEYEVSPHADFIGQRLEELSWREQYGINIALIERGDKVIYAPGRDERLYPADRIFVIGTDEQLEKMKNILEASELVNGNEEGDITIQKMVLAPRCEFVDKSIRESKIREITNGLVIGLERKNNRLLNPNSTEILQAGDVLWIAGNRKKIKELKKMNLELLESEKLETDR
jgi:CPA2 family monovalent cation:H+ antiporter-2